MIDRPVAVAVCLTLASLTVGPQVVGGQGMGLTTPVFAAVQVRDLDATAAWYRTTFDLHEANHLRADDGRYDILILTGERLTVELLHLREAAEPPELSFGLFKVGMYVADIEAAHRWVAAHGGRTDTAIFRDEALGVRSFVFRDPEGNLLQVFEPCGDGCQ